jgi:hypothetical protein
MGKSQIKDSAAVIILRLLRWEGQPKLSGRALNATTYILTRERQREI